MHEPIYHLGLRFYLLKLRGSLKYTLTRPDKTPKVYEICDSDLDDGSSSENSNTEEPKKLKSGLDFSAVGIQLRLIKNDGVLKIEFEGRDGAAADWTFHGLALIEGGRMVAAAATQTDVEARMVESRHEESQTDIVATQSIGCQTSAVRTSSTGVQTTPEKTPLHLQFLDAIYILGPHINTPAAQTVVEQGLIGLKTRWRTVRKILDGSPVARIDLALLDKKLKKMVKKTGPLHTLKAPTTRLNIKKPAEPTPIQSTSIGTQTESSKDTEVSSLQKSLFEHTRITQPDLKRKASATPIATEPLNKRARSTRDTPPWPRHIYMECFRNTPIFKGDVGVLHIDVEAGTVWFEGWYGKEHMRVQERKQIDLRDKTTRISFERYKGGSPIFPKHGVDNATHYLTIDRLNAKGDITALLHADCLALGWQTWGMEVPYYTFGKPLVKDMIPITNTDVVVDALVYCVDVASGREAVHDPETEHKLAEEVKEYKALQKSGRLSDRAGTDWEWTVRELKRRRRIRKQLKVVDGEEELDKSVMSEMRELLGMNVLTTLPI